MVIAKTLSIVSLIIIRAQLNCPMQMRVQTFSKLSSSNTNKTHIKVDISFKLVVLLFLTLFRNCIGYIDQGLLVHKLSLI